MESVKIRMENLIKERVSKASKKLAGMNVLQSLYESMVNSGHIWQAKTFKNICFYGAMLGKSEKQMFFEFMEHCF